MHSKSHFYIILFKNICYKNVIYIYIYIYKLIVIDRRWVFDDGDNDDDVDDDDNDDNDGDDDDDGESDSSHRAIRHRAVIIHRNDVSQW